MNFRSILSVIRKIAVSQGFWLSLQTVLLGGVLTIGFLNLAATTRQGKESNSQLAAQTSVLETQAHAIADQTALLREIVAGQQSTAKALLEGGGGGQIKITSWKYRDPETGACMTFQVTTTQAAGESFEDFQARHFLAVRTDKALMPPDPTCP